MKPGYVVGCLQLLDDGASKVGRLVVLGTLLLLLRSSGLCCCHVPENIQTRREGES
jgi:hypothetical protein